MMSQWPIVGRQAELATFERALPSPEVAGLMIVGRTGVGKTRLADECLQKATTADHPAERVIASRTTCLVPLAAVAGLLPDGFGQRGPHGQLDTGALFDQTIKALRERYGRCRLVTIADDAALLDSASLALLGYLAVRGAIFLVTTVRTGEPLPDLLAGLWREGRLERVDLEDLSQADVGTLLNSALGGPVEAGTLREFWEITRGNPLYVRELVMASRESGALVERSGVWYLERPPPSTARLADLIEQRIGGLTPDARSVVELLAWCQPLELGYLETIASDGVLESLERTGLVTLAISEGEMHLAHPIYGKVIRAVMPRSRARTLLLAEADRLEAANPDAPDALRIAMWRLDAGERPDKDVLVRGAQLARYAHDFRIVRRLMEAVPSDDLDAAGALLLGEALYELGAFDQAERVLRNGQELPGDEEVVFRLAVTRSKNAQWGLCQPAMALEVICDARKLITSQSLLDALVATEASVMTFSGQPDRALSVLEALAGTDRRTQVLRAIAAAPALALTGRTSEAVKVAQDGHAEHLALGGEPATAHPAMHLVNLAFALSEAGRLAEAEEVAKAGAEQVASNRVYIAQIFFAVNLGRIALLQGRLATARRYYAEAAGLAEASRFAGPRRLALSGLALAHAMRGEADAAAQALTEREALPPFGFRGPEQQLAEAWTAWVRGRPRDAATRFRDAAAYAAETGHRTAEAWILHDLNSISGEDTSARLQELASACDSPLVSGRARQVAAASAHNAQELVSVADDFEELGAMLLAAEAMTAAADVLIRAGQRRASTAARQRAGVLCAFCEGAATPGLSYAAAAAVLSEREREIGMLAAKGLSSKDIAERLYLSVRTVNNHLEHIYTKLGITSRAGLAQTLGSH